MLSTHALKIACSACGTKVLTTILLVTKLSAGLHSVVFEVIEAKGKHGAISELG